MTEKQQFLAMLTHAGIGHGIRHDYEQRSNGGTTVVGESVQVEVEDISAKHGWRVTEFGFDKDGKLYDVVTYEGEPG